MIIKRIVSSGFDNFHLVTSQDKSIKKIVFNNRSGVSARLKFSYTDPNYIQINNTQVWSTKQCVDPSDMELWVSATTGYTLYFEIYTE